MLQIFKRIPLRLALSQSDLPFRNLEDSNKGGDVMHMSTDSDSRVFMTAYASSTYSLDHNVESPGQPEGMTIYYLSGRYI